MWTPKRILILIAGLAVFLSGYGVYAYFLGGIDGLPPLPLEYAEKGAAPLPLRTPPDAIDSKLKLAFGEGCAELKRKIKLDLRRKGYGLAADTFDPVEGGRIKLTPFSAFVITKKTGRDGTPEINTVRCDEAYLTLDREISNMAELGNRKIIKVELRERTPSKKAAVHDAKDKSRPESIPGSIIHNNRGTRSIADDVELLVTKEPLFYVEEISQIWTKGAVRLLEPHPDSDDTTITAVGMKLFLTKDKEKSSSASAQARHKHKKGNDGATGVDRVVLLENVNMFLWIDSQAGFLGTPGKDTKKKPAGTGAKKGKAQQRQDLVTIKTDGPFTFEPGKDWARFDSPVGRRVEVLRVNKELDKNADDQNDKLECARLELKFRRKAPGEKSASSDDTTGDKEIDTAHATARSGELVDLHMVTDKLHAEGAEMIYHGATPEQGPKTVIKGDAIKGDPLHASKEGHHITAQELTLIGADKAGNGQQALARGPGQIDLFDKTKPDRDKQYPWHAVWKDTLTSVKDHQGDKVYDLLTLTGDALFIDDDHKQELRGNRLQVWLEPTGPTDGANPAETKEPAAGAPRQKPAKVDAFENVSMVSPEMNVKNARHLVIHFKDGVVADMQLPDVVPSSKTAGLPESRGPQTITLPPALPGSGPGKSNPGQKMGFASQANSPRPGTSPDDPRRLESQKPKQPVFLEAREVAAYVTRMGSQNFLRELVAEGAVHVTQKPATPQEKGVDITGELLNLHHFVQGDILYVFGDTRKLAQLQLGELKITGPKVTINQRDNVAEVDGLGAMRMPSKTTFDGGKPVKPGTYIDVHWNKDMIFDGKMAQFHGGVVAYQDSASLKCQDLQVTLDRAVSFKEGQKGGQEAKVEKMLCDRKVYIVEEKKDDKGGILSYHRLESTQVHLDNPVEQVMATGPGKVYLLEWGNKDQGPTNSKSKQPRPDDAAGKELHLTRVDFSGRMFSNNKKEARTSIFYDNVEVFHAPADRADVEFNPDRPPKGGFYLKCDLLTVYTKPLGQNKTAQYMQADNRVTFRTQEFYGHASRVKYNEEQDMVIFEGPANNPARLYQFQGVGRPPREIKGTKILYNRKTGQFNLEGGTTIESRLEPRGAPRPSWRAHARLDAYRQDQAFPGLRAVARDDG